MSILNIHPVVCLGFFEKCARQHLAVKQASKLTTVFHETFLLLSLAISKIEGLRIGLQCYISDALSSFDCAYKFVK